MQEFHRCPGDREAVERCCAAADFVENNQGALGCLIENAGGFNHLDHEGGSPPRNVVGCSDPAEQAIDNADFDGAGGHERAHLRHDRNERVLAQEGRFARHVRAGDQPDATLGALVEAARFRDISATENAVVLDEWPATGGLERLLDNGMPAAADFESRAVIKVRAHIALFCGKFGEG